MNIRFTPLLLPVLLSAACTQDARSSHDAEGAHVSDVPLALTQAQVFYPSADAEVRSATPNTNYGNSNELGSDSDPVRHAHLRFEVSGIAGPVQSATLRCYAKNGSVNGPALYRTQGAWTEQGLTWNNRPSTTGPALVDLGNIPHGTWVEVDVTSAVQGNGTYAFAWVPTSSDSMICDSRETARRPELRVEAESDPSGPRPGEVLAWSEDFDGTSLDPTNWTVSTGTENHSQSNYIQGAVRVQNGALAIRTRRHCVSGSEALTDANVSSAPCPSGKTTRYSSGKVQTPHQFESGRLEIRAKLPSAQTGVTPAIWMRNEAGWCAPGYGGLDVAKWQGNDPTRSWSATQ